MNPRDHQQFVFDVYRYRPVLTVLLATVTVIPSLWEAATGNLSFLTVLGRLALSLLVCGAAGVGDDRGHGALRTDPAPLPVGI